MCVLCCCPQVAYFWLTAGLAFTPLDGSALYIDTRLVPHCSDPCTLTKRSKQIEGRCEFCSGFA